MCIIILLRNTRKKECKYRYILLYTIILTPNNVPSPNGFSRRILI